MGMNGGRGSVRMRRERDLRAGGKRNHAERIMSSGVTNSKLGIPTLGVQRKTS